MPKLIHVWSDSLGEDLHPETARRNAMAAKTWDTERKAGGWLPARFSELAVEKANRTSAVFGDRRRMPFIRDMIEHGMTLASDPQDIVVLTNADICLFHGVGQLIANTCLEKGALFAGRWDFSYISKPITDVKALEAGRWSAGSDLFAFTKAWWVANGNEYPDMVLGCERWDLVMRNLIKITGGVEIKNAIYHEMHDSFWNRPENRKSNPGNVHNVRLCAAWFDANKHRGANTHDWVEKARTVAAKIQAERPRPSPFFGNTVQLRSAIQR